MHYDWTDRIIHVRYDPRSHLLLPHPVLLHNSIVTSVRKRLSALIISCNGGAFGYVHLITPHHLLGTPLWRHVKLFFVLTIEYINHMHRVVGIISLLEILKLDLDSYNFVDAYYLKEGGSEFLRINKYYLSCDSRCDDRCYKIRGENQDNIILFMNNRSRVHTS